jgi:hypothetical protein
MIRALLTVWIAFLMLSIGFLLGFELKPNIGKISYLPPLCSEPYIPTSTEWKSLHLTAEYNNEQGLTDKLVQTHFSCYPYPKWFQVILDLKCQPTWNHYLGNGVFDVSKEEVKSALMEGVKVIMNLIQGPMPNVTDDVVKMDIYMRGFPIATYEKRELVFKENLKFKE